ncbi:hypothetical protein AN957_23095 [Cytobacillus solani]|uniref:BshB3 potential contributor to bacillithiol synthesis n=2 Tax=Cytobacillus solani TaxID=1637975 RepID=A0A0Q3VJ66_9BACI|nr:hypothetical protein AMS60_16505 [Bacillus sp. FJAT-21945]KQL21171.1 hypothetical protein AN957_23095 [Cytobacillus solani]
MKILIAFVFIILIIALVGTLMVTRKTDEKYSETTKKNTTNLTFIYVAVIFLSIIALGVYISFFA